MSIYVLIWPDVKLHKWPIAKTIMHKSGDLCFYIRHIPAHAPLWRHHQTRARYKTIHAMHRSHALTQPPRCKCACARQIRESGAAGRAQASQPAAGMCGHELPPSQHEPGGRVQCCPPGVQQAPELGAPLIASMAQISPVPSGPGSVQSAAPPGNEQG